MSAMGLQLLDLHSAAKQNDIMGAVKLLEEGAHIDKRDPYGYTPLHWACQKGHTHTVQALLAAGANVHVRDKWRRTPLHRAAKEGHKEVVAALLNAGAEINAQGDNNWTPLHCSSFHGRLEIVEMLLRRGADQAATDLRGRTSAAVCDMGLYDVEQSVKDRILQLLQNAPAPQVEAASFNGAPLPAAVLLALPPSTGAAVSAGAPAPAALPLAPTPAAAPTAPAANASPALTAGTGGAGPVAHSGGLAVGAENTPVDTAAAASAAAAAAAAAASSAASAASAAENGVFALWDTSVGGGSANGGLGAGGIMEADTEDAIWHEMWAMLHVPDPDNPDNNLYSEVKTLRKDVKRLRNDLEDTTNDKSSKYEGIFGASAPGDAATATLAETPVDPKRARSEDSTAGPTRDPSATGVGGGGGGGGVTAGSGAVPNGGDVAGTESSSSLPLPQAKRQKQTVSPAGVEGVAAAAAAAAIPAVSEEESLRQAGDRELREQVMKQSRLIADMAKELEALRRERSGGGYAAGDGLGGRGGSLGGGAGEETSAVLPVLDDRTLAHKVR